MPRIVNNRICYANHNVLCAERIVTSDIMLEIEAALTPHGDAKLHRAQLDSFPNVGTYCEIEKPVLTIAPFWDNEKAELRCEIPTRMLATVTLHNGNQPKVICVTHCARSESFLALYGVMSQHGIDVGRKARREAETNYFKMYDALVAAAEPTQE